MKKDRKIRKKDIGKDSDQTSYKTSMDELNQKKIELQKLESELLSMEEKYSVLFDNASDALFLETINGKILDVNKKACEMLGYTKEELLKLSVKDLVPPEIADQIPEIIEKHLKGSGIWMEAFNIHKNGTPIPVSVSTAVINLKGNKYVLAIVRDITERKKREERLRYSEETNRALLNATFDIAFLIDKDGKILIANQPFARRFNKELDELIGMNIYDLLPPEIARQRKEKIEQALMTKQPLDFEDYRDGKWFHHSIYPIFDPNGNVSRVAIFARDITERKIAEQNIKERLKIEKTTAIISSRFLGSADIDRAIDESIADLGTLIEAERANFFLIAESGEVASRIGEWSAQGILSSEKKDKDIILNQFVWWIDKLLEGEIVCIESIEKMPLYAENCKRKFAELGIKSLLTIPIFLKGELYGFITFENIKEIERWQKNNFYFLRTISEIIAMALERKRIETALKESEERLRMHFENASDIIFSLDTDFRFTSVSPSVERIMGIKAEEMIGKRIDELDFLPPESIGKGNENLSSALAGDIEGPFTYFFKDPQGNVRFIEVNRSPLVKEGKTIGVIAIGRDVTEKKLAEEKIKKLNEELEERVKQRTAELEAINQELKSFSYSVSHDLRAPLLSIDGYSSILEENYSDILDLKGKRYLKSIRQNVKRMTEMIEDLQKLSQVVIAELDRKEVNLSEIVLKIIHFLKELEPHRQINIKVAENMLLNGDERLITILMENLILNAWKFTRFNPNPEIEVGVKKENGRIIYFVKDNGIGFDMKNADKLFVPFGRLHQNFKIEGTGIGLSIVKRIINRHGGEIWAESEPNKGAIFYFTLL